MFLCSLLYVELQDSSSPSVATVRKAICACARLKKSIRDVDKLAGHDDDYEDERYREMAGFASLCQGMLREARNQRDAGRRGKQGGAGCRL